MKAYRIKKSNIDKKGRGLYAARDIKEGEKIIDYVGKIITKKQTEESEKFDNAKPIYLFNLNKKYDLDGDVTWNTARLINHSCSNNCDYNGTGLKLWVALPPASNRITTTPPCGLSSSTTPSGIARSRCTSLCKT